jgi:poly(glycerol-phosphate) alpha-glucosyltransferase
MSMRLALPGGPTFAITWGIPTGYGGMTSAMFERSRTFVRLAHRDVHVLTFEPRPDYPTIEAELFANGEFVEGMRLLNLWDWFRENPTGSAAAIKHVFTPLVPDDAYLSSFRDGTELTRTRLADDGSTPLQVDHYRLDGTLLASDRRDVREFGTLGGRSVVLCDAAGKPARSWSTITPLYRYWLDRLVAPRRSLVVIDSKAMAELFVGYSNPHAMTVHVVHASHLVGTGRPIGPIRPSRRNVFGHLGGFDAVAVLSDRQREDITVLLGPQPTVVTIPNGRQFPPASDALRDRGHGVVVASLMARKRVGHAIGAVLAARSSGVSLDVYGDGPERASLEELVGSAGDIVRLHGHVSGAGDRFALFSFVLLTSTSEGFPLVLVEAMSSGCIPIAYDVPYGPADLIRDGVNGFLVEPADEEGLVRAIERFMAMSEAELGAMRGAAIATATKFSDRAVMARWSRLVLSLRLKDVRQRLAPVGGKVARRLRKRLAPR